MEHFYKSIHGWASFIQLYVDAVQRAPQDRPSTFVEIGSWMGRSAAFMAVEILNSGKPITLHCIDPWTDGGGDLKHTEFFALLRGRDALEVFNDNTKPVSSVIMPHRLYSHDARVLFEPKSIDYIMIDGLHTYEAVQQDIADYLPLMRDGAVMSGDDYLWPGVHKAVHEAFGDRVQAEVKRPTKDYLMSVAHWWVQL
ncbi:MAG: class I SAM-dependent methyltransferase [Myxococcaceae bacterium]|nr:MAG: class I SAM-dependent methyltransferase [Myxococcaceae bacterium]